ncbi:hypothetical protein ALC56_02065 [Trachymyrmex septentrionalis]|uniref:Uncharacterized protein n=1 Tax=Trachymyrmex septentrionalis TaxID=34720 RepID=A0A195FU32_9HYME|nr:hypothetical protein ALC56_02065 [Trachymyrmex septentrionalis]
MTEGARKTASNCSYPPADVQLGLYKWTALIPFCRVQLATTEVCPEIVADDLWGANVETEAAAGLEIGEASDENAKRRRSATAGYEDRAYGTGGSARTNAERKAKLAFQKEINTVEIAVFADRSNLAAVKRHEAIDR